MNDINTFGGRFKAFRKSKKLKGKDVGEIMRVLKTQISMIENNKTLPPLDKVIEFAMLFPDLDLNWLLLGKGKMLLDPEQEQLKALLQSEQEELQSVKQDLQKDQEKLQAVRDKLDVERNKSEALEELLIKNQIVIPKHRGASPGR